MPTKSKKAALLARIAKQKAKQKQKIFSIPKIKLPRHKTKRRFVPTVKSLAKRATAESKMREFMRELIDLKSTDFEMTNPLVRDGFFEFRSFRQRETDEELSSREIEEEWSKISLYNKLLWIIDGYANKYQAEWGRKKFAEQIKTYLKNEETLLNFISDYLAGDLTYDRSLDAWLESARGQEAIKIFQAEVEKEGPERARRIPVTEEEKKQIEELKGELSKLQDTYNSIDQKMTARQEQLNGMTREELNEVAIPLVGRKTDEQLINMIINVDNERKRREKRQEISHMPQSEKRIELREFEQYLLQEEKTSRTELSELTRADLVLVATENRTTPSLIRLILADEFGQNKQKLRIDISALSIQIHNLSLGKYIPPKPITTKFTRQERKYMDILTIKLRLLELESLSYSSLLALAQEMDILGDIKYPEEGEAEEGDKLRSELVQKIFRAEFSDYDEDTPIPELTKGQVKKILGTLENEQLNILALDKGISRSDRRSKQRLISEIVNTMFPVEERKKLIFMVPGRHVTGWSYEQRKEELESMSEKELKTLAYILGLNIRKGRDLDSIVRQILSEEEYQARLIPIEDAQKQTMAEQLSKLTGKPVDMYDLWSLEDLKERLDTLGENKQDWVELERQRLVTKLGEIDDLEKAKYTGVERWTLKKLRRTLRKIGGPQWENYRPLVEDYSFIKCMKEYQSYYWIEGRVTGVWLAGPGESGPPKSEYVFKNKKIIEGGRSWYQANKKYFSLQCNSFKKKRRQRGQIFTCYTQTNQPVKFRVGYTVVGYDHERSEYKAHVHMVTKSDGSVVQRTFIIQNEQMFRRELQENMRIERIERTKFRDILDRTVDQKSVNVVSKILSKALLQINPMKKDYGIIAIRTTSGDGKVSTFKTVDYNTPYIQILVNSLRGGPEETNREFFSRAADLLVYLQMAEAKSFQQNIEIEYYLPDILATLSPAEKLPEVFEDPEVSQRYLDQLISKINNRKYKIVTSIAEHLYYPGRHPRGEAVHYRANTAARLADTRERLAACVNKGRVGNATPEEIIYYKDTDDNKIYCFTVDELWDRFVNDDIVNPETDKNFDLKFVSRFNELYNKRLADEGLLTNYFQKKYGFDMGKLVDEKEKKDTVAYKIPEIAPDFWTIIGKDISELEDQLTNEAPGEGDEIDEDREVERREKEVEEKVKESIEILPQDVCVYCKKHITDDDPLKTVIKHDEEARIIKFCSFKCFESKDDWRRSKRKKKKKKRKERKEKRKERKEKRKERKHKKHKETEKTKTEIKGKLILEGIESDRLLLPLMSKEGLRTFARERGISIPQGMKKKMAIANFIFDTMHPKARKGIFKEKEASSRLAKAVTRREKRHLKKKTG